MANSSKLEFEGHAIVSVDGMIADRDGAMPPELHNEADWRLFQGALDRAKLVVLGSIGHLLHPNPGRRRLVLTRSVDAFSPDPRDPLARFWNPAGLPMQAALEALGVTRGTVAITGGTGIFDYFAPSFTAFDLVEVPALVLRGGTSCFSAGHPRVVLAARGLRPAMPEVIDAAAGVTLTRWTR